MGPGVDMGRGVAVGSLASGSGVAEGGAVGEAPVGTAVAVSVGAAVEPVPSSTVGAGVSDAAVGLGTDGGGVGSSPPEQAVTASTATPAASTILSRHVPALASISTPA